MGFGIDTILLLVVLGVLIGVLFALRRMYVLERKIAKLEMLLTQHDLKIAKRKR